MSAKIHFRPHINNQTVLFPQRIDKDIAQNDPVRLVNSVVESLDLVCLKKLYKERGRRRFRHFGKEKAQWTLPSSPPHSTSRNGQQKRQKTSKMAEARHIFAFFAPQIKINSLRIGYSGEKQEYKPPETYRVLRRFILKRMWHKRILTHPRERFNLNKNQTVLASRILSDTQQAGLIKPVNPEMDAKRYYAYIPYYG